MFVESIAAAVSDVAQQLHLSQVFFTRPVLFLFIPGCFSFIPGCLLLPLTVISQPALQLEVISSECLYSFS